MRILHLNYSSSFGGASDAARTIHFSLLKEGIESKLLVGREFTNGKNIVTRIKSSFLQDISQRLFSFLERKEIERLKKEEVFGKISLGKYGLSKENKYLAYADIIHLHWVNNGFLSLEFIKSIEKPIVWTLHDMWPITGLCHYSLDCEGYKSNCGNCFYLKDNSDSDISYELFQKKKEILKNKDIVFVATSKWMHEQALKSSITKGHKVVYIPLSVDKDVFRKKEVENKKALLTELGIGSIQEQTVLLYGAINATTDLRKGFDLLKIALSKIPKSKKHKYILLVFGENLNISDINGIRVVSLGLIKDKEGIAKLYNAADLFLMPSIQEAFGLTTLESLSCETPVVAFENTGAETIINHKENGYLAKIGDSDDFFNGIEYFENNIILNKKCIAPNNIFNENKITEAYLNLYKELVYDKLDENLN